MRTIYKLTLATLIVLFFVFSVQARDPEPVWRSGNLVLWNNTILEGDVSYNWAAELVSFRQPDGRIHTFSANQVSQFGWFDYTQSKQRNFVSLVKPADKERNSQVFFEVCMDGSLAVVRRFRRPHGLLKRVFSHPAHSTDRPTLAQNTELFDYYVYDAGRLLELERFYTDIYLPLMTAYDEQLHHFVAKHNINDRFLLGRLVVISHYNWLVQQDSKTASAKEKAGVPN